MYTAKFETFCLIKFKKIGRVLIHDEKHPIKI